MEYLENEVFGLKTPVSTTILSLTQQISLDEAESLLTEFSEAHRGSVDVAFKSIQKSGHKTRISIQSASNCSENARIYLVSPENATDPAVLAQASARCRDVQLNVKLSSLKDLGLAVDPLLADDFHLKSYIAGREQSILDRQGAMKQMNTPVKREASAPTDPKPKDTKLAKTMAKPAPLKTEPGKAADPAKAAEPAKTVKPKKEAASFFKKVDKSTAMKSMRKPLNQPVPEKAVIQNAVSDDEDENEEEPDDANRESKISNLENLFADDEEMKDADNDEDESEEEEVVTNENDVEQGEKNGIEDEFDYGIDEDIMGDDQDENSKDEKMTDEPNESANIDVSHGKISAQHIYIDSETGKRMCRVRKVVKVELEPDEEGFTQMGERMMDVLVEVDENGQQIPGGLEKSFSETGAVTDTPEKVVFAANPDPPTKPQTIPGKANSKASSKASTKDAGKSGKKQGSLMNFFNVRKK